MDVLVRSPQLPAARQTTEVLPLNARKTWYEEKWHHIIIIVVISDAGIDKNIAFKPTHNGTLTVRFVV